MKNKTSDPHDPLPRAGKPGGQGATAAARRNEPEAVILAGDILRWLIPTVARFPRNLWYGLGHRIESAMTDVLEAVVSAQYERGPVRRDALGLANRRLQVTRHLVRLAVTLGSFSLGTARFFVRSAAESRAACPARLPERKAYIIGCLRFPTPVPDPVRCSWIRSVFFAQHGIGGMLPIG